jgi:hypothetical protein
MEVMLLEDDVGGAGGPVGGASTAKFEGGRLGKNITT